MTKIAISLFLVAGALWLAIQDVRAVEGGSNDPEEQYNLGKRYIIGDGLPRDNEKAVGCYRKAAESGLAKAQCALGICYAKGEGVSQDYTAAVKWFRKAAEQGNAKGEYCLGIAYLNGNGVAKDPVQAIEWLRKSAGHSNAQAQCLLGLEYFWGRIVPQNFDEACKWVNLGLSQAKAADFVKCTGIIPPPVNPPLVKINGVDLAPGKHASVKTPYGIVGIKCVAIGKETAEILIDGEDTPRTLGESGPVDIRSKLFQEALDVRRRFEHWAGAKPQTPQTEIAKTATPGVPPLIVHGSWPSDSRWVPNEQRTPPASVESNRRRPNSSEASAGTGFFVTDDGYLVTCEHVVRGATCFYVKGGRGALSAKLVKKDRSRDLALLKVDGSFYALSVVREPEPKLGQSVFTIGYPNPDLQGVAPKLTRGEISSLAGIRDNPRYFQISVPVQPGNSGGALMDESGNVIGVVTARLDDIATYETSGALPQNVNYAVKGHLVREFLGNVPELSGKLKAPGTGRDRDTASTAAERAAVLVIAE